MDLIDLIDQKESNFLDFKEQWYANNDDLIFDILCLANSLVDSDRYLVIGIEDKNHSIKDVSQDIHRKTEENLHNLIQSTSFNIKPIVNIQTIKINRKEIDILIIKKTKDKPYFLTKDRQFKKGDKEYLIRAGVVYTRDGAVNTPKNGTASEYQISRMWQERFGLTLSPMERLNLYIKNREKWKSITVDGDSVLYYEDFPEFTICFHHIENRCEYEWAKAIAPSISDNLYFKYHTTVLKELYCSHVDGGRYFIVYPNRCLIYYTPNFKDIQFIKENEILSDKGESASGLEIKGYSSYIIYYEIKNSFNYFVNKLYNRTEQLQNFFRYGTDQIVLLLDKNDNVYDACRNEFLKRVKKGTVFSGEKVNLGNVSP